MTESPVLPPRPEPPRRLGDSARAWLAWWGPMRLAVSAASVLIVVGGIAWLVRTPPPPTEAALPFATPPAASAAEPATPAAPANDPAAATTVPTSDPAWVVVHVAGSVTTPGVYQLDFGARVDDAISAAGGPRGDAELDGLNLAAVVADGQRIYVPEVGEVDLASVPSSGTNGSTTGSAPAESTGPIDLNAATAAQLETLPGVGPATATAIVDERERNGPFARVSDLERVPGIGPAKLAAVADLVTV